MANAQHRFGNMAAEMLLRKICSSFNISNSIELCAKNPPHRQAGNRSASNS
jgi:hypothetical protein